MYLIPHDMRLKLNGTMREIIYRSFSFFRLPNLEPARSCTPEKTFFLLTTPRRGTFNNTVVTWLNVSSTKLNDMKVCSGAGGAVAHCHRH